MKPTLRDPEVIERMRMTFELYELAETMKRQNLRRQSPELSDDEIEEKLVAWLEHRPGAPHGDANGPLFVVRELRKSG
jgi:Rv0078B-related antitoxin